MGFETRWRIDPILTPAGWKSMYADFFAEAFGLGVRPKRITLGIYREKNPQLDTWREKWGLPPMEWEPMATAKQGTHYRPPADWRVSVYRSVIALGTEYFADAAVDLCKETYEVRSRLGIGPSCCNCLKGHTSVEMVR